MTKDLKLAFIKPNAKVWPARASSPSTAGAAWNSRIICRTRRPVPTTFAWSVRWLPTPFNHHPGQLMLFGGTCLLGRPSMGAWVTLWPGKRVAESSRVRRALTSGADRPAPAAETGQRISAFCLSRRAFPQAGRPGALSFEYPPGSMPRTSGRLSMPCRDLNREHFAETGDIEIASRIASYELAFRMQIGCARAAGFFQGVAQPRWKCTASNKEPTQPFATNCLLARRMVERGVRFVMLTHPTWDDHTDLNKKLKKNCDITDQPDGGSDQGSEAARPAG